MRNKMIQEYFDVDWDVVWRTVKHDLPLLKWIVASLLVTRHGAVESEGGIEAP